MSDASQAGTIRAILTKTPLLEGWQVQSIVRIATLWSNYGSIERVSLRPKKGSSAPNRFIIVKTVSPPWTDDDAADEGHLRKLLSYEVERWFYHHLSTRLPGEAKVAISYPITTTNEGRPEERPIRILMEDLSVDFPQPARGSLGLDDTKIVLNWLAAFHATFWGIQKEEEIASSLVPPPLQHKNWSTMTVWEQGTYWYLDTRREEFESIGRDHNWLLEWVDKVDDAIKAEAQVYGTLVHGDVKGANICFSRRPENSTNPPRKCALYDFQYVGVGLVSRDLVYFLGTSVQNGLVRLLEDEKGLLRTYHSELLRMIGNRQQQKDDSFPNSHGFLQEHEYTFECLWMHWELAIVDWYRFMAGWGFWGNDGWITRRAKEITAGWKRNGFSLQ